MFAEYMLCRLCQIISERVFHFPQNKYDIVSLPLWLRSICKLIYVCFQKLSIKVILKKFRYCESSTVDIQEQCQISAMENL